MRDALKFTAVLNAMLLMLLLLRERSCTFYVLFLKIFLCVQNIYRLLNLHCVLEN